MVTSSDLQRGLEELSLKLKQSVKLDHLLALTDETGLLQHATFSVPARREGYTVDDNVRALVFASRANRTLTDARLMGLARKFISFTMHMQEEDGRLHNYMDFSHRIADEAKTGDHLGRAIWATGVVLNSDAPAGLKSSARQIFDRALPWARQSDSLRTKAYATLGVCERLSAEPDDRNLQSNAKMLADSLADAYDKNRAEDWEWFERILTYDNPRLSQALLAAYSALGQPTYREIAESTLRFLMTVESVDGRFAPIGSRGWYHRGGTKALYDQQPIETGAMVETATLAVKTMGAEVYEHGLRAVLGWFFGMNSKWINVYDEATGACYDGITQAGLNQNQGAESTVAFLLGAERFVEAFSSATEPGI